MSYGSAYLDVLIKLLTTFAILLIYVKLSGRSKVGLPGNVDVIGNMVIGAMVGSTVLDDSISLLETVAVVVTWALLLLLMRHLRDRSDLFTRFLDGSAVQLVKDGVLLSGRFSDARLTLEDFEMILHQQGVNGMYEVKNAFLEPSGRLAVEKKDGEKQAISLILKGVIQMDNLKLLEKDKNWLLGELKAQGYEDEDEIFFAEWVKEKLWVYPYHD